MARVSGAAVAGADMVDRHASALRSDPLYLDRCQVDTPEFLVEMLWRLVGDRRQDVGHAIDFGAGDARFARGEFESYLGYEIDASRIEKAVLPPNARVVPRCAFSHQRQDADVCVGNPPYVRNQDLPVGWRQMASDEILRRTGVSLSGLANAWQYFLMLGLWSIKADGLLAQVLPFEWVSRPAASPIRQYIDRHEWSVDVYRLPDGVFADVLTAASVTVVDKRGPAGWRYHDLGIDGTVRYLPSPTGTRNRVLTYTRARGDQGPRARRGLSPGTQKVLTLSEGQRVHAGLHRGRDVVPCVTSLRQVPHGLAHLASEQFDEYFVSAGAKCWLIRTDREPSTRLRAYLDCIDEGEYQTSTCLAREQWWRFPMPAQVPQVLVAQSFQGRSPKALVNAVGAHAVGGVAGIYNLAQADETRIAQELAGRDLSSRLVPYAKQMRKLEINQINFLLASMGARGGEHA